MGVLGTAGARVGAKGRALAGRRPSSMRELGETLVMMVRAEPPPVVDRGQPPVHVPDSHEGAEVWGAGRGPETVLDADCLEAPESQLDALLFGESRPGLVSEPGLDPDMDADPELDSDQRLSDDLLETLARLAQDTSPGLIEAPDTLPG